MTLNLFENLKHYRFEEVGTWPLAIQLRVLLIFSLFVFILLSVLFLWPQYMQWKTAMDDEKKQKQTFELKQRQSALFNSYQVQVDQLNQRLQNELNAFPQDSDVPNLLNMISQMRLSAGLEEVSFEPTMSEQNPVNAAQKVLYYPQANRVVFNGSYHNLAQFVSALANMPYCITVNQLNLMSLSESNNMPNKIRAEAEMTYYALAQ